MKLVRYLGFMLLYRLFCVTRLVVATEVVSHMFCLLEKYALRCFKISNESMELTWFLLGDVETCL